MQVFALHVHGFRGWPDLTMRPAGHVLVTGEPRAGRSDLIEALRRVLDPEVTRTPPGEFDVFQPGATAPGNTGPGPGPAPEEAAGAVSPLGGNDPDSRQATIEITLGALGDDLQQHFYRKLELWDRQAGQLAAAGYERPGCGSPGGAA